MEFEAPQKRPHPVVETAGWIVAVVAAITIGWYAVTHAAILWDSLVAFRNSL